MRRTRMALVALAALTVLAVVIATYAIRFRSTSASDLGTVNSVVVRGDRGRLCVNDSYDENHCRDGNPLILPAGGVVEGDCVEVRTNSRSEEVVIVKASAIPCFTPYDE